MERGTARFWVAGCLVAMVCGVGCQQVPSRRVPPEPPYGGGWSGQPGAPVDKAAGFNSAPSPSTAPMLGSSERLGGMPMVTEPGVGDPMLTPVGGGVR